MDSSEFPIRKPLPLPLPPGRELQLQGPHPAPLKVRKFSFKIKKPPVAPQPLPPPLPPQPPRQPVMMKLVQNLAGLPNSSSSSHSSYSALSSSSTSYIENSGSVPVFSSPASLATLENANSASEGEKSRKGNDVDVVEPEGLDIGGGTTVERTAGLFPPGILSPLGRSSIHSTMYLHKAGEVMENWSDLCNGILKLIMDKFSAIEDIVHFGAVCRPWRSVSVENWQQLFNNSIMDPWLMLAEKEEDGDRRGFYSLSTQKVYHLNLPEACGRRCWSSQGWLITLGIDWEIHLLNPFSRVQIRLPPQPTLPYHYRAKPKFTPKGLRQIFIQKVVLSSRPSQVQDDEKCMVVAISSQFRKLAFSRLGDEVWTAIESSEAEARGFMDVIYFNGEFYAINYSGRLFICNISSLEPKAIVFAEPLVGAENHGEREFYLVESVGELFMVLRDIIPLYDDHSDEDGDRSTIIVNYKTCCFEVYKFNFGNRKWKEVKSLDNCALFVGNNSSFAILPSNHHNPGFQPNSIYFTDSFQDNLFYGAGNDMGVFRMETQVIESHYIGPDCFSYFCTPLWICPSL